MNPLPRLADRPPVQGPINKTIRFCLENKLVVFLLLAFLVGWGMYVMPFKQPIAGLPSNPVPVDAIPDIGENQQIVFTDWPGRSPQDVEDQVTYPLTIALQGMAGVKNVRSQSMFGFSTVFVIFNEDVEFYWARTRLLERLNIAQQRLPEGVIPALGPDATALGQVFWYTLEGRGFDMQELRSIQDWYVRNMLQSTEGVSEVASIGGYVKEYQVDVNPDAMRAQKVMLQDVFMAVNRANIDVGAETIDFNGVEYTLRGKGFIKGVEDVENVLLKTNNSVPIYVKNVATVHLGPALRRGALDKEGAEAVGGVVLVRHGENPLAVIERLKQKIDQIQPSLPRKTLADGTVSQVRIVPFYDRTDLIHQTLDTLKDALVEEVLITCFVVFILLAHFRSNILISANLPIAVLASFILMRIFNVESNLMSLGGIAIAIGSMVDMGIILCENIVRHFDEADPNEDSLEVIYRAASEVGSAVVTAIATTLVSFIPIFALTGPEGKLFRPLAYTKTFALFASVFVALTVLPAFAHILFRRGKIHMSIRAIAYSALVAAGVVAIFWLSFWAGLPLILAGAYLIAEKRLPQRVRRWMPYITSGLAALFILALLTMHWMPLGLGTSLTKNLVFVFGINILWTSARLLVIYFYPHLLSVFLRHKVAFMTVPAVICALGLTVWLGFDKTFGWIPGTLSKAGVPQEKVRGTTLWVGAHHEFPGLGREFMPSLDEGSFLFMPTTMPHASIAQALDIVQKQDRAIRAIPEVDMVVGKIGRAETALDPAPVSMIETVITYKSEYGLPDPETGKRPRLWRDHIRSADDIWNEIVKAAEIPGSTSAPKLQPIAARIVMLQSGMRAPMGVKVRGGKLEEIEKAGYDIARLLKEVPGVNPEAVIPDRVVGKPYLEIEPDRKKLARYKIAIQDVQDVIEIALGGIRATTTVEGRERYPVRVRYQRELRDTAEAIERILVPSSEGVQVPLAQLATITYVAGPQEIKSEDTFLVSYVLFDKLKDFAEVDVVEAAAEYLRQKQASGGLVLPPNTHYIFAGSYENQLNFQKRFMVLLPASLLVIFLILYFQFHSTPITLLIFVQIAVVWAGGFIALWLAGQPWFDFDIFGRSFRDIFHLRQYNLSVAVWVGFIALFGLATDDAVVIVTYLNQLFRSRPVGSIADIRNLIIEGGRKRVRPCLMTTATTVLALLPVLTSTGKGADVMIPMALPLVGGMTIELITLFITPVMYGALKELLWKLKRTKGHFVIAVDAPPPVPPTSF
ncbi:MAG: efflux RND transporter permease subunit [Planctomycetaceae bacterium]|nr:efflux RND transporter permease subunit [Planctomycetaceae bacterium]